MDLNLTGKLALVSGSTAGIGLAIASTLAQEGARVIVNGRSQSSVDDVVAQLKAQTGGDVQGFAGRSQYGGFGRRARATFSGRGNSGQQPGHL